MSDTTLPSWRVRPPERSRMGGGIPSKVWMILGGLAGSVALAGMIIWLTSGWTQRGVPLIESDGRPFKVRPDSAPAPAGQQEIIFERGAREPAGQARLTPGPEQPRPDGWRQPAAPARPAAPPAAATPTPAAPAASPAGPTPARPAAAAPTGRTQVQLGALRSEEAARAEWERLRARVPELAGRSPAISRFEREGQPTLWRLRVGGLADRDAARTLCEQIQARGGACAVLGS